MKKAAILVLCGMLFLALSAFGKKKAEQYSELSFLVVKDDGGQPLRNAAVILHNLKKNGNQGKGGFELKTDAEGKTAYPGVPYGKFRIQVIMPGYQTFGDDVMVDQQQQLITIRMKKPAKQYSIYEEHEKKK